jgi:CubicO group peptidase (beta-lactamase class C family)
LSAGDLSSARLARLHDVMAAHVHGGAVPGLVTLVSRRGEVHVDAVGVTDLESGEPMHRGSIFRISSMTKPITAVAAMILVEECVLRLDDSVEAWLPELAGRRVLKRPDGPLEETVPAQRPITVRDLLTFTMGFGIAMAPPDSTPIQRATSALALNQGPPSPAASGSPDEWIQRFSTLPLIFQPGERWMYNTGSDVLGVLIARASGVPFDAFLRARVFDQLGMKDTGFSVPEDKIDRLVTSYWTGAEAGALTVYDAAEGGKWSRPPAVPSGAGGLVSTVDDFLAFGQMLLGRGRRGAHRILSRPAVEVMTTDQLTPGQKAVSELVPGYFDGHGWGLGMAVVTRRDDVAAAPGRYGWDGGLGTSWYSDPGEDLVGILMTQSAWTSPSPPPVCRDFWTSVYQAIDD